MQETENIRLKKPEKNEYIDLDILNENSDRIDKEFEKVESPPFDDSGTVEGINSFTDFLSKVKSKMNIFQFYRDFKAGMKYVLHTGRLVNNATTTEEGFALDARMGKTLYDMISEQNKNIPHVLPDSFSNGTKTILQVVNELSNRKGYYYMYHWDGVKQPLDAPPLIANQNKGAYYEFVGNDTSSRFLVRCTLECDPYNIFEIFYMLDESGKYTAYTNWSALITNSDINIQNNTQKILLTTTKENIEISEPANTYYIIRNDYCFVSLSSIKMTSIEGGNIFSNLPKPVGRVNFTLHTAGGDSKPIIWGRIDDTAIYFNNINSSLIGAYGWGSFCYPIAK